MRNPTGDAARRYRAHARRKGLAPTSIDVQSRIIDLADRELGGLTYAPAEVIADWVVARPAAETRRTYACAIRAARDAGVLTDEQVALLPHVKMPRRVAHPQADAVVDTLIDTLPDPYDRAAVILARYAGLRLSETCSVGPDDLVRVGRGWRVRVVGKGNVERLAPIPGWAVDEVRPWLPIPTYPPTLGARVGKAIKAAGGQRGMHTLRSAYATEMMRASHDIRLVQAALGHATIATTAVYLAVDDDESTLAVEALGRPRHLQLVHSA